MIVVFVAPPLLAASYWFVTDERWRLNRCPPGNWREFCMRVACCHLVSRWSRGGTTEPQTKRAQLFRTPRRIRPNRDPCLPLS